jgi:PAS domain S-box-containing protein
MRPRATSSLNTDKAILGLGEILTGPTLSQTILETLAAAVYTCDHNGFITFYNKAASDLWGREPEIGKDLWCGSWKIYTPDGKPMLLDECPMAKALKGRKPVRGEEVVVERPDGLRRHILPHPDPIFDSEGRVVAVVNMLVDISELKQRQNELLQNQLKLETLAKELEKKVTERTSELSEANEILVNQNKELEQFAFIASHDLQEPVRKIKTFTSRIQRANGPSMDDQSNSYLDKIKGSASRLEGLINDLLNYSRLGYTDTEFVETDLNVVMDRTLNDFELVTEEKSAFVHRSELPVVKAIPLQMNQLFHNLIGNSLKFSKGNSACQLRISSSALLPGRIAEIGLNRSVKYTEVIIEDEGIGFDQEFAQSIFKIFKRLNSQDKYPGSGIGLALCQKIVNVHKGKIFATSEAGKGTSMHIVLPVER